MSQYIPVVKSNGVVVIERLPDGEKAELLAPLPYPPEEIAKMRERVERDGPQCHPIVSRWLATLDAATQAPVRAKLSREEEAAEANRRG